MATAQVKKILQLQELLALDSAAGLPIQLPDGTTGHATLATLAAFLGGGGGVSLLGAAISATQSNSTTTPVAITGLSFSLPAGGKALLNSQALATLAATTTGLVYGFEVVAAGTTGSVEGAWFAVVNQSNAAAANAFSDGDAVAVAAGATTAYTTTANNSTAGNNGATLSASLFNNTDAACTVNLVFATEVAASAAVIQPGTSFTALVG